MARPRRREGARAESPERVVAVTGAHSFVGAETIRRLEEDRAYRRVIAIDLRRPAQPLDKTQFHKLDLTLPSAGSELAALFAREGVDTVVHAAFLSNPTHDTSWAHELEVIGTMHVLDAAAAASVRKLVVSSLTAVYGAHPLNPNFIDERHELKGHPRSRFIDDKVEAEKLVRRFRREHPASVVTVLRAAPTLGPTIQNYVTRIFARPVAPVLMGYDPLLQFVHEQDLGDAFKLALDRDVPGELNVVGNGVLPYTTVLAMMGKLPLPIPHFLAYPLASALWATQVVESPPNLLDFLRFLCVADGELARRELRFRPRFDIRRTIHDFLGLDPLGVEAGTADLVAEGGRA